MLQQVGVKERAEVLRLLREVTKARTLAAAGAALREAVRALNRGHPKPGKFLEEHGEEILSLYQLPAAHRERLRSTNLVERLNQETKRRTRVIRVFPNEAACLRLVAALAMETNLEWTERVYLPMPGGREVQEVVGEAA